MTLYRQIVISIITLLVLGFMGTVIISTNNLRAYLETQLEVHAQDTATSLGLSLSPHMKPRDMAIVQSMVDAIFDRGYYSSIGVTSLDGETLLERRVEAGTGNAPQWFVDAVALQAPAAEALIMSGWKQSATVYVTSNPGNAYRELWSNTVDTFWLFLISAVALILLALLAVRVVLKPLRNVEHQANAICNRSYAIQKQLPRTRELRRVVLAMNHLASKVKEIFAEQAALTERLRKQAYMDPVTGLGNRRFFTRQLKSLVESPEQSTQGAFLLLELNQLSRVNKASGYTAGNELLARTAKLINARMRNAENYFAARIKGAEYGIIAAGISKQDTETLAESLCHDLLQLRADGLVEADNIAHIGIAMWQQGDTLTDLLSEADIALRAARSCEQNSWKLYVPPAAEQANIHGEEHWHDFLRQVVETGNIILTVQPVYGLGNQQHELLHREVLLRIIDTNGTPITASIFMPMAERVGLASSIDRLAIDKLLDFMVTGKEVSIDYAVNISATSLHDPEFKEWLCRRLLDNPAAARRLLVEFTEYSVLVNVQDAGNFIRRLGTLGCRCGIDQFGRGFYSFGYLRNIKVNYLKIDGSYTRGIDEEEDNQFFIQALTDTAHSVDIKVIAQSVETSQERSVIEAMNLDGIQGYLTGKPETLQ
jgi:diguanylate cyclase (GGDEF)-like protein